MKTNEQEADVTMEKGSEKNMQLLEIVEQSDWRLSVAKCFSCLQPETFWKQALPKMFIQKFCF